MRTFKNVIQALSEDMIRLGMGAILTLSMACLATAQTGIKQVKTQTTDAQERLGGVAPETQAGGGRKATVRTPSRSKNVGGVLAAATRTSPFDPPEDSDHSFSTDDAPKLDTGCIFRASGPIVFNIEIKRFVGELNSDGTLADADKLIASGALSKTAKLIMPGFDVDSSSTAPGVQPERDRVSVNGEEVGFLQGVNNQWILNSFEIDIRKIKFAERGENGSPPSGGVNEIRIDIDTANTTQAWCTSIDWGSAGFRALSPIILIHGNNSDDDFFVRQGFTQELDERALVYDNKVFGDSRANPTANFISVNTKILNDSIPRIARSIGAKTVHLVAHSKGGLDARSYLANFQPQHDKDFKVISLTTLSTPHDGSVLADLSIERSEAARQASLFGLEFEGFPAFTRQLTFVDSQLGIDNGRRNLTTGFVTNFNNLNRQRLASSGTIFNTIAADMDLNSDGGVNRLFPDEFFHLRQESDSLSSIDSKTLGIVSTKIVDNLYQILRKTRRVHVSYRDVICIPFTNICRRIYTLTSVDNATLLGNDSLVTIPSAQGAGSFRALTTNSFTFEGPNGRNHSNVANRGVAQRVLPWLFTADRTKGGLRDSQSR
jgi:triacylglycerol esterase/lipase EstA (alpha/beta hydrolase family)